MGEWSAKLHTIMTQLGEDKVLQLFCTPISRAWHQEIMTRMQDAMHIHTDVHTESDRYSDWKSQKKVLVKGTL